MALFSRTKKQETKSPAAEPRKAVAAPSARASSILSARVTEKATKESEQNVYTFNVVPGAGKVAVREEIKRLYNVLPASVRLVPVRGKALFQKGKRGRTASGSKAYVTLKKGDQIEFI